jgi:Heterokaryon incompatibility protein (HET)
MTISSPTILLLLSRLQPFLPATCSAVLPSYPVTAALTSTFSYSRRSTTTLNLTPKSSTLILTQFLVESSMALLPTYHYTSLESYQENSETAIIPSTHFRLLVLDSGEAADEVSCSLEQYCLASPPDYEAISYVWGDPTETCNIICSGQQLAVTKSLYSALCRFRFADQKRVLWADAICINQQDLRERSAQVSSMGKIYSKARQVLIWLGEESDSDSEAFNVVSQLEATLPTPGATMGEIYAINTPERFYNTINSISRSSWLHLAYLLSKPWFQRIWIIQEVLMAQSAQLFNGSKSITWSTFTKVTEMIILYEIGALFAAFKSALSALSNIFLMRPENLESRRPFFRLLCYTRSFKSTDPRDKLYALLGISDSGAIPWESPDYTVPVSKLFVQYTKKELMSGSLAHLSATDYIDDIAQVALPTWVPDWSRPVHRPPVEALQDIYLNAGGTSVPSLSFSSTNDLLIIKGKKVSCVERLGTIRYSELVTLITTLSSPTSTTIDAARVQLSARKWFLGWLTDCHKTAFGDGFSPTQETFSSQSYRHFCQALCSTRYLNNESPLFNAIIDRISRLYLLLTRDVELQGRGMHSIDEDEKEIISTVFDIDRYVTPLTLHQYFCTDDSGGLAWVPGRAQTGDVLCIFLGAKVPHLLRLVADGRYKLIGACYLHNYMSGEVIEADQLTVQEFVLV